MVIDFIKRAEKAALNMTLEIKECEIILELFEKN